VTVHRRIITVSLVLFSALSPLYVSAQSQVSESGETGMSSLLIPPSARIAALGGAGYAIDNGASSQWSNPALLTLTDKRKADFSHTEWIAGITQENASFATPFGNGAFGIAVHLLDSGDIEGRADNGSPTGNYSITTAGVSFSYATHATSWLSVGATYKKLYQKIAEETAGGDAFDLGITVETPFTGLRFGASGRNYGRMDKLREERSKLPETIGAGFCYSGIVPVYKRYFSAVADYIIPRFGDNGIRLGFNLNASEHLFLRLGYRNDSDFEDFCYGAGFILNRIMADLSYSPLSGISDEALRITLAITGF
jgi:hypothetical protein